MYNVQWYWHAFLTCMFELSSVFTHEIFFKSSRINNLKKFPGSRLLCIKAISFNGYEWITKFLCLLSFNKNADNLCVTYSDVAIANTHNTANTIPNNIYLQVDFQYVVCGQNYIMSTKIIKIPSTKHSCLFSLLVCRSEILEHFNFKLFMGNLLHVSSNFITHITT